MSCHNPRMREYIGDGRDFHESQLPTNRSILQKFILEKDNLIHDKNLHFSNISTTDVSKPVASGLERHWKTISSLFESPVIICGLSLVNKVSRLWDKAYNVFRDRTSKGAKLKFLSTLDKLFDISCCPHTITLCQENLTGI